MGNRMSRALGGSLVLLVAAGALNACTQFAPYRLKTVTSPPAPITYDRVDCFSGRRAPTLQPCDGEVAGNYSVQHRYYRYQNLRDDGTVETRLADYHMAFVEFDDQGWFADRRQMEALFMLLKDLEQGDRHVLILLYAHGWKHNADRCDSNVHCFSRLVERMDILERHLDDVMAKQKCGGKGGRDVAPRHVVAVYVGWRGLSVEGALLSNISFWTRKATAERVGRGGVKELLVRLNDYRRIRNPQHDEFKTQLVITGHSFGGLVIYSALSHALVDRAARVQRERGTSDTAYSVATSFGDFVVLVNPAFEGSLYEPLFNVATNRCYSERQRPVMLIVTSSADDATGIDFPAARFFNTLFEHAGSAAQGESIRQTVGHDPRYESHRLEWRGGSAPAGPIPGEPECGCQYLGLTEDFKWWEFTATAASKLVCRPYTEKERAERVPPPLTPVIENGRRVYRLYGDDVALSGDMSYSANYPYLVITADPEIIPDHNSIYREPFVEFLQKFFLFHVANARPFENDMCYRELPGCLAGSPIPCERSCQRPNGAACTSQE